MSPRLFVLALVILVSAHAADPRGDNADAPASTPQEQLAKFHVPPGFEVQLVAAEPEIQKPINLTFDAAGRLWVTGSEMYPWPASVDALGQPIPGFKKAYADMAGAFRAGDKAPPISNVTRDSVRILSDFGPDGRARKVEVFADGLNVPSGVQPLPRKPGAKGDTAIVYSIPNIWRLEDTDGDRKADKREVLYGMFGYLDTHGGSSSYLYWIDGWIYGTHGFRNHSEVRDRNGKVTVLDSGNTYRFKPDGSAFEIYTHGQTNPFGLTVDPLGNFYSADSHSKPVYMLLRGGYYEGIGKQHDGLGFAPRITDDDHGSSAIAGIAYYAAEQFPEEFRGNLFNGNPVTQKINRDQLEWRGSTPKAIRQPDFLSCDDPWFRPVQVKLGPNGALYIADFYNPIIGHYEVPLTDPRRDHTHGRIWRVVWRGKGGAEAALARPGGVQRVPEAGQGISEGRRIPPEAVQRPSGAVQNAREAVRRASEGVQTGPEAVQTTPEAIQLPPVPVLPDLTILDAPALVAKLADPNLTVRTLATNELVDRVGKLALDPLWKIIKPDGQSRNPEKVDSADFTTPFWENTPPAQRAHALMALRRLNPEDDHEAFSYARLKEQEIARTLALKMTAEAQRKWVESDFESINRALFRESLPSVKRAAWEVVAVMPYGLDLASVIQWLPRKDLDDPELYYAAKVGLREYLKLPDAMRDLGDAGKLPEPAADFFAGVLLAVQTPAAADFLLAHLSRTKLHGERSGEFLRHAVLYLPPEKLGAIAGLIESAKDAPLAQRLSIADNLTQAYRQRALPLPAGFTDWTARALLESLASNDDAVLKRGIEAVRNLSLAAKLEPLATVTRDEKRDGTLRLAALEATANISASRDLLVSTFRASNHMILRKRAAELLAQNGAADLVLIALPNVPDELAIAIGGALGRSDAGATAMLDMIEAGKVSPRLLLNRAVSGPLTARPKPIRDRAATLVKDLPPEDARLNAVIAGRAAAFAKAKPDEAHGAQIFQQSCAACHRFRNAGGNVGPNLDGVIARGPARLIEDILDPNRNVDPLFRQTTIETTDGDMLLGANVREQGDTIVFADPTGKETTLPKSAIKKQTASALSLMPPIFESAIPPADLYDLVAFLLSQAP